MLAAEAAAVATALLPAAAATMTTAAVPLPAAVATITPLPATAIARAHGAPHRAAPSRWGGLHHAYAMMGVTEQANALMGCPQA